MWCCLIFERSFDKIQSLGFIILIKFQRLNAALHRINGIYVFHGKKRTGTATSAGYDRMSIFTGFHLFNQIKANQSRFFRTFPFTTEGFQQKQVILQRCCNIFNLESHIFNFYKYFILIYMYNQSQWFGIKIDIWKWIANSK